MTADEVTARWVTWTIEQLDNAIYSSLGNRCKTYVYLSKDLKKSKHYQEKGFKTYTKKAFLEPIKFYVDWSDK